jgi:F-type H+-transporting ATPase subunit delta
MSVYSLSSRYAKSLLGLAIEKNVLEPVFNDINYFREVLKRVSEFKAVLKNPEINTDKKQKIFDSLFGNFNPITKSFFTIVLRKRREEFLPDFASTFVALYYETKKITTAKLTTAVEPDEATIKKVKELMKRQSGIDNVLLEAKVDSSLIGGFVLQYDDKMVDASILRQLETLDEDFMKNDYIRKI